MRHTVAVAALAFIAAGCNSSDTTNGMPASRAPKGEPPSNELLGMWVVESAEAIGQKAPPGEAGGMKLEFAKDKVTWHFRLPEGWKSWDGTLRHDPKADPKQIDLSQPNNPATVALGIYKIEGNRLTISMDVDRPTSFDEPSQMKLVLMRQ